MKKRRTDFSENRSLPLVWVGVVTLFPEMFSAIMGSGIIAKAISNGLVQLEFFNIRSHSPHPHLTVDDRPYGGGPGMVLLYQPLRDAIRAAKSAAPSAPWVVYLSPQGKRLEQACVKQLAKRPCTILVCGRYEGIDERLIQMEIDEEWSVGDYVLSGGELPAMLYIDSIARELPEVLGHARSAAEDSFSDGLLDCPHYTRPECIDKQSVPKVLLSGDHARILQWRLKESLGRTWLRRPDLLEKKALTDIQKHLLKEFQAEYRVQSLLE